ncbi:MAG: endonuclease/exonuclease/phosphatase family protein [Myxococcota bacterium]
MLLSLALLAPLAHAQDGGGGGGASLGRNVRIATYNIKMLPFPEATDGDFADDDGVPLSNEDRATLIAQKVIADGLEIVAFNEAFDRDTQNALKDALTDDFPYSVDYIGNDSDLSDSGLMLFSRYPFEEMELDEEHVYEDGDVEVTLDGTLSESSGKVLGFTEYHCDVATLQADCVASKGAGLVRIALPMGESLEVVFTHFRASYGDDDSDTACGKQKERQQAMRQIEALVRDATDELEGAPRNANVLVMGDLNIDGNPFHTQGDACLDAEWQDAFTSTSDLAFSSCADLSPMVCDNEDRVLFDAWAFTTSPDDLGRSASFDFTTDLADPALLGEGQRLDYLLLRGTSQLTDLPLMVPQHVTIAWPLAGAIGNLSDHLPVAVDLLLPGDDVQVQHTTPSTAQPLIVPSTNFASTPMAITVPGQLQWVELDGEPGTYTVDTPSGGSVPVAFDVYARHDLSRPIAPRRAGDDGGLVYVLDDPPYFVRTFATFLFDPGVHDRAATTSYSVTAKRHDCTSPVEACILTAGEHGDDAVEVTWPANQPVKSEDALWFEFYADDPVEQKTPTFHEFEVYVDQSLQGIPAFTFDVVDFDAHKPLPDVKWTKLASETIRQSWRADNIHGNPAAKPSFANHLLKVFRPMSDLSWGGTVKVFHGTNLTYFQPLAVSILQEEDDFTAHDELRIYMKPDNTDLFYETVTESTLHLHASKFTPLPQIDEIEDGGAPWPAASLGSLKLTEQLPLLMLEDDDDNGSPGPGDFVFAEPQPSLTWSTPNRRALAVLATDVTGARLQWNFTDDPSQAYDDTDYWYRFTFDVSHTPPCFLDCP